LKSTVLGRRRVTATVIASRSGTAMKYAELKKLRAQASQWPTFKKSWDDIPTGTRTLVVDRMLAKSLEPLSRFTKLQHLFVHSLREQDIQHVASIAKLRSLLVWKLDATSVPEFRNLKNLESLGVYHASKLISLSGIEGLSTLKHLFFYHIPNVRLLDPIKGLKNLEELVIEQSYATNKLLSFASLKPLKRLTKLKCLDLRGVHVDDGDLQPIAHLPNLRYLFPCSYSMDALELAKLAKQLNAQLAKEDRIGPTLDLDDSDQFGRCKKCDHMQKQLVGKVGKKYRLLACPKCDAALIQERKKLFESAS
jgi:hypothetical protein